MPRTLADRLQSHAQQKARLAEREMLLKEAERKARTRRLIQAGGLVEKAGLLELEPNALYGAVLSLRDRADNAEQIREWAALGGRAFAREARAEDEAKEPVAVSFPAPVARGVASALRAAGLRFNRLREEWEGRADFDKAEAVAKDHGGAIRRVGSAPMATAAQ
jgi:Conjugal transfer protein TraD